MPHRYHFGNYARYNSDKCLPMSIRRLSAIKHCTLAITDSFHGTVFSVIYRKPFVSITNFARGSARYKIFNEIGLGSHLVDVSSISDNNNVNLDIPLIDSEILNELKTASLNFLTSSLNG